MSKKKVIWNDGDQFYKGIRIRLIPYSTEYYSGKNAKRFELGKRKYGQNIWIPNKYLHEDGTLKPNINIDFVIRQAHKQKKLKHAHIDIENFHSYSS